MSTVYCFTGYPGAGKSEATRIAQEFGYETISMGDIVRNEAIDKLGENATSEQISNWATENRKNDNAIFAHLTVDKISPLNDDIVIDGLRSPEEIRVFQEQFDEVIIIEIHATKETRLRRITERGRRGEDIKTIENRDTAEKEWGLDKTIDCADYQVTNETNLDDLREQLLNILV